MSETFEIKDIKSVLKFHFGENFDVVHVTTQPLTTPGENYGSVILAVDVQIKKEKEELENLHTVAKMCPANDMLFHLFNIQHTFKKEMGMYLEAIPTLEHFEKEYGIEDNKFADLFAKCYGARINMKSGSDIVDHDAVLILENLKILGYDVGDRMVGFDLAHAELILQNLARFHATPIALKLHKPSLFKEKVLPSLKSVPLGTMPSNDIDVIANDVINVLKPDEYFTNYLEEIKTRVKFSLSPEYKFFPPKEPFATIAHCDFWVNNTMILKNETGKPIHNKIVDLQLQNYNSFAFDLLFFLYSSVVPKILEENYDDFIKLYFKAFIQRLKEFEVDLEAFSWENFVNEIARIAPIVFGQILFMYKPILTERGQIKNMSDFDEEAMKRMDIVSPQFAERVKITSKSFIEHKWI